MDDKGAAVKGVQSEYVGPSPIELGAEEDWSWCKDIVDDLSPSIEDHDVQVKAKTAIKFLKDGDKLKVSLRFRGRERDYVAKGYEVMEAFAELVSEYGVIEKKPKMEGRRMNMFLAPKRDK